MRILSFDGGGVRGVISSRICEKIDAFFPGFSLKADILAGTSTGAIIAAGLASGMTAKEITAIYKEKSIRIFKDSLIDNIKDVGNTFGAQYSSEHKKEVFKETFGDLKLGELKQQVLIVSYQLDNEGLSKYGNTVPRRSWIRIFDNEKGSPDCVVSVVDALMAATAAPTYWPIYSNHIDGGIRYNNPVMIAIAEAIKRKAKVDDISALSIGTGINLLYWQAKNSDWGLAQWAKILVKIFLDDDAAADVLATNILNEKYCRIQPTLNKNIELDDYREMHELCEISDKIDLESTKRWIQKNYL